MTKQAKQSTIRALLDEPWTANTGFAKAPKDPAISFDIGKLVRVRFGDGSLSGQQKAALVRLLVQVPWLVQVLDAYRIQGHLDDRHNRFLERICKEGGL